MHTIPSTNTIPIVSRISVAVLALVALFCATAADAALLIVQAVRFAPLFLLTLCLTTGLRAEQSTAPFPEALDAAVINQTNSLQDTVKEALLLGNGDIHGFVYEENSQLKMRITRNDVWDARMEMSNDATPPTVDVSNHTWGVTGLPYSWNNVPYPCPRTCAKIVFGVGSETTLYTWSQIRAQGVSNTWIWSEDLSAGVMGILGQAGDSCGYDCTPFSASTDTYTSLWIRVSGTTNAQFFIEGLNGGTSFLSSGWIDSPATSTEMEFPLSSGQVLTKLRLYTRTDNGELAQNWFYEMVLQGATGDDIAVGLYSEGSPIYSSLDIHRAVANIQPEDGSASNVTVRALSTHDVFLLHTSQSVHLEAIDAVYPNDYLGRAFPQAYAVSVASTGTSNGVEWVTQEIPGDLDWPGMSFAVALAHDGDRKAVAIATSLDSSTNSPLDVAMGMAQQVLGYTDTKLLEDHEDTWATFWSASGVSLSDMSLQHLWYRNLYFMRCISKPGVNPVGLFAGNNSESPAWHGGYTMNYNCEQTFWGWQVCNHLELMEPYVSRFAEYLPRAQWLAKYTYGYDGCFYPHNIYAYEPTDPASCRSEQYRMSIAYPWSYTAGLPGFVMHNIWLTYKYAPDLNYLINTVYPLISEAAKFYLDFLDDCATGTDGKKIYGPSVSPEHGNFGQDNVTFDIGFTRLVLEAVIESAAELNRDALLVTRCQNALAVMPDYPAYGTAPNDIVVDRASASPIVYNVPCPIVPIFPSEQISWFSEQEDKDVFNRTLEAIKSNGNNSMIMIAVAKARMSETNAWEWMKTEMLARQNENGTLNLNVAGSRFNSVGIFTEQFAASGAIAELLLQSVGDIIRVFPAWPDDLAAEFHQLRAQGGFLVSASIGDTGDVGIITVESTAGGRLELLSPWPELYYYKNGVAGVLTLDGTGLAALDTKEDDLIQFSGDHFGRIASLMSGR